MSKSERISLYKSKLLEIKTEIDGMNRISDSEKARFKWQIMNVAEDMATEFNNDEIGEVTYGILTKNTRKQVVAMQKAIMCLVKFMDFISCY